MSLTEFSIQLADELKRTPTRTCVIKIVKRIQNATVAGRKLNNSQIERIMQVRDSELEGYQLFSESFDNAATISLMAEVHKMMALKSKGEGKNNG